MKTFTIFAVVLLVSNISADKLEVFLNKRIPAADRNRIIGGSDAAQNQFPYQVAVWTNPVGYMCGGAIITATTVLTAGHCVYQPEDIVNPYTDVVYGILNIYDNTEASRICQTANRVLLHPSYTPSNLNNDVALVFAAAVTFNNAIAAVALPTSSFLSFSDTNATITGWGYTNETSGVTDILKYVDTVTVSRSSCQSQMGSTIRLTNICTSGNTGGPNIGGCYGDSGGPVVALSNNVTTIIGIVSFVSGYGCTVGRPTGHTRVTRYLNWINSNQT